MERRDNLQSACNYAKGMWIADSHRPLYSGFGCGQWLPPMWSCRLTRRTDFSFEGYRWQPKSCDMPEFVGPKFLRRMQDKTIAFVGDSLGREQFHSLMCMITSGIQKPEVENVGWKYGLVVLPGVLRPDGWAYRFSDTNTTILFYWSATLCYTEPINNTDTASENALHLDRPPTFLSQYLNHFDVLVLNTAHHWNRGKFKANKWLIHVNGKRNKDKKLARMRNTKKYAVRSIVKWLDFQIGLHPGLQVFFRTMSPRHFVDGDWDTGGSCNITTPLSRGNEVTEDESGDRVVAEAVKGTKIKLLDITALSELRDEGHMSHYSGSMELGMNDCLHWCLPGIPDTWNEILCAQI